MPNLIHSLDALSLSSLYSKFSAFSEVNNFYNVHDCFAVTPYNISNLKSMLAHIYIQIFM
jgi:hypothetical protein